MEAEAVIYKGRRLGADTAADVAVTKVTAGKRGAYMVTTLHPEPSLKLHNHSPTGFNWGYGGSGPAQLALALLLDATGDEELAVRGHQDYKQDVISGLPDSWVITRAEIFVWLAKYELGRR